MSFIYIYYQNLNNNQLVNVNLNNNQLVSGKTEPFLTTRNNITLLLWYRITIKDKYFTQLPSFTNCCQLKVH